MTALTLVRRVARPVIDADVGAPLEACASEDPELMFPSANPDEIAEAKAVCRGCPVLDACREWALRIHPSDGVWAGMTVTELQSLGRKNRRLRQMSGGQRETLFDVG